MQESILGEFFLRQYTRGLYSHLREYRKIFLRSNFPHISHIWRGVHVGANTCRACIRTRANTGKYSWGIIYVLVSFQGVTFPGTTRRLIRQEAYMSCVPRITPDRLSGVTGQPDPSKKSLAKSLCLCAFCLPELLLKLTVIGSNPCCKQAEVCQSPVEIDKHLPNISHRAT